MTIRLIIGTIFVAVLAAFAIQAQQALTRPLDGKIIDGSTYVNSALEMKVNLPGTWEFMDLTSFPLEKPRGSYSCEGPFCKTPEIRIALRSVPKAAGQAILLKAYKLEDKYRKEERFSLKNLATIKTTLELGTVWIRDEEHPAPTTLGDKEAYKLLVHSRKDPKGKGIMYVCESNGYVFLITAFVVNDAGKLQEAIEKMALGRFID